jgi:hypothetical protein
MDFLDWENENGATLKGLDPMISIGSIESKGCKFIVYVL